LFVIIQRNTLDIIEVTNMVLSYSEWW